MQHRVGLVAVIGVSVLVLGAILQGRVDALTGGLPASKRVSAAGVSPVETTGPAATVVTATVDFSKPGILSDLSTGVTHTQYSLDPWGAAEAVERGKQLLQASTVYQNQHIMGWGASNPEPSPGVYNWNSLDRRVQLTRDTGGLPVLTLAGAPGWMRPPGYADDWEHLSIAPAPEHVGDFAALAARVAQRYPDVKYFQVWNELKGMWGTAQGCTPSVCGQNRWDYERYTTLYNAVHDAVKAVRPDAQLGGPYVVVTPYSSSKQSNPSQVSGPYGVLDQRPLDVIKYWLAHKHGGEFITLDGGPETKDEVWVTDEFTAGQYFVDVAKWLRGLDESLHPGAKTLPLWWAEWKASTPRAARNLDRLNAVMASDLAATLLSGASVPLLWGPQGDGEGFSRPAGIWTDSRKAEGGQPTPFYDTQKAFFEHFGPGTEVHPLATSDETRLAGIASREKTLLINKTEARLAVSLDGAKPLILEPHAVSLIDTPTP